ncbi:MAG TPA: tetratricopeptide repeat protein [Gemmatimonadales bacterium]
MGKLALTVGIGISLAAGAGTAAAQVSGWVAPTCDLNTGHYLVNSALTYLRSAARTRHQDQKQRDLADALRVIKEAIAQGEGENGSVWYFLGRYHAVRNDLVGADSAWDRAAAMLPGCASDINVHRRTLWVPILNRGVHALQAGDVESAKAEFLRSNTIFDVEPPAYFYLGQVFADASEVDSAVAYYRQTLGIIAERRADGDSAFDDMAKNATFNSARLLHRSERYDSAVVWYQRYRQIDPDDAQAITGQAGAMASAGQEDAALALYDSVLMRAAGMSPLDLFSTGVVLFRADRYDRAEQAFLAGLERNPYYRDALFNLSNTYLKLSDREGVEKAALGEKMFPIVQRLLEVDPNSSAAMRLMAAAYQLRGMGDSTLAMLERQQALTFDITVSRFLPAPDGGIELGGVITNLLDSAQTLPAITFELLDELGEVLEDVDVGSMELDADGGMAPFSYVALSEGIVAWRYRVGG